MNSTTLHTMQDTDFEVILQNNIRFCEPVKLSEEEVEASFKRILKRINKL